MRSRLANLMIFCGAPLMPGASPLTPVTAGPGGRLLRMTVRGTVRSYREGSALAVIAHEKIPGCMEAMTTPLTARRREDLQGLKAGDRIRFRLTFREDDCWIDQVQKHELPVSRRRKIPA